MTLDHFHPHTFQESINIKEAPSKSQRKREMLALQKLGESLIGLSKESLKHMTLPEKIADAVKDCQRITAHEARRRQMQLVGKIMRTLDKTEVNRIRTALDTIKGISNPETAKLRCLNRWREHLLTENEALTRLLAQYPDAAAQQLHTLIRNARREKMQSKPSKAFRELFQVLKTLLYPDNTSMDSKKI
ncbi:ribosome biogenesis factor YjgA [Candidatus Pandoraea novymonadis]|uniref:Dual-action ribosomal maturation protein DarP n=1 Tax=Candidatus Pandoraea novymonadis TaxID=1808959 RepID=A0ABX5FEA8_9BURK|nr:ribosome biogenesis factor YjgA [Candidatus Pandoraea novymonadis]PSB91979.1 hypothetical protein BZL35_00202 [Candidatus Pandoraea novymonadis]